jgi:DNA-directed RNA polymerase
MVTLEQELAWEQHMVDNGVDKYFAALDAARFKAKAGGGLQPQNDESATSYGASLIREHFEAFEAAIGLYIERAFSTRGRRDIAGDYLARMDVRTTAFLAAKTIIDTISVTVNQTELVLRIAGKVEDQMRMTRFSEDYEHYFKALCSDMKDRGVKNYRHKRKVLTHCHDKAVANDPEGREWISWPKPDRIHIGMALLELFITSTGLVERNAKRIGNKLVYLITGTDYAVELIHANVELFQFLHPEYMPTLIRPKDWSTPWDGGFHDPELRRRRPMVKTWGYSRKAHSKALREACMPGVYSAVNLAQSVAWRVNEFVLEQAGLELQAKGIGCPTGMNVPAPISPIPMPERGDLNDAQYGAMLEAVRANLTPDEEAALSKWRGAMRDWHTRRVSNRGRFLGISNTYKIAKVMRNHDRFYFVHTFDTRGRLYPCGVHLTPQGTKLAKGLLEFADPVRLGRYGYWHLALHAAGVFGVDKVSLEDRVAWIHEHAKRIIQTWEDPASAREFWGAADKPYMFLAACRELAEIWVFHGMKMLTIVNKEGLAWAGSEFESRIPCAQDGSCNGLQHFSAMLLDPMGARNVNMAEAADTDVPNDIYGATAEEAARQIYRDLDRNQIRDGKDYKTMLPEERQILEIWLKVLGVDRSVTKRPTMIVPYGGKKPSCLTYVGDALQEKLEKLGRQGKAPKWDTRVAFQASWIMHQYVWAALDEVVVAARRAMTFLAKIATVQNHTGKPLQWTTPLGFPCFQDYKSTKPVDVRTQIAGGMRVRYLKPTDDLDESRMRNAFPPNFVHSMDATHLMMTVNAAEEIGIDQFALVHDSFGVPAGQCEGFHQVIREQFCELYRPDRLFNLLQEQKMRNPDHENEYPSLEMVSRGDFNIEEVLNARYFFG